MRIRGFLLKCLCNPYECKVKPFGEPCYKPLNRDFGCLFNRNSTREKTLSNLGKSHQRCERWLCDWNGGWNEVEHSIWQSRQVSRAPTLLAELTWLVLHYVLVPCFEGWCSHWYLEAKYIHLHDPGCLPVVRVSIMVLADWCLTQGVSGRSGR